MLSAKARFNSHIGDARSQSNLYDYLTNYVQGPTSYDDILRFQIVFAVSAFDKLIHELVRIGMVDSFIGTRPPTPKFQVESISISIHKAIVSASIPPSEVIFEQEIARKIKTHSYQDPSKVADGLSYIWAEPQKWQVIGQAMGMSQAEATTRLKLIVTRRNAIVHEADIDPVTLTKNPISRAEATGITDFIETCGNEIVNLVL